MIASKQLYTNCVTAQHILSATNKMRARSVQNMMYITNTQ